LDIDVGRLEHLLEAKSTDGVDVRRQGPPHFDDAIDAGFRGPKPMRLGEMRD
jgi:hypothetical protein